MNDHHLLNSVPILIYQMGKVGSTSVYDTLNKLDISNPIYHVHSLNTCVLNEHHQDFIKNRLKVPSHILAGFEIIELINNYGTNKWKIITVVRDLIKNRVSRFFQNIERFSYHYPGLINTDKSINTDLILEILNNKLSNFHESKEFVCTWFDREMKHVFDIDVYDYEFNHKEGYTIIQPGNMEILILKTELLSSTFAKAIREFLDLDFDLVLESSNTSEQKDYYKAYKKVLQELSLSNEVLNRIYSSKYMSHFYPSH